MSDEPRYVDVLFDMPDGSQALLMVLKDGRYRLCTRPNAHQSTTWGPPVWGSVAK